MRDGPKRNVLGVLVDPVDYEAATDRIVRAACERRGYSVSALAVHGVMTGVTDREHRYRLNHLDLVTPDGQPVRWAMNAMYGDRLADRVYGPNLTLRVCEAASRLDLPVYLYGSRPEVVSQMVPNLEKRFPGLVVAGAEPSRFRQTTPEEKDEIASRIKASGARIAFVGLGCPRQEVFAYEYRDALSMPVLAVGAAFEFLAGVQREAPQWMQDRGLQWLHRLAAEPRRLWKRYVLISGGYVGLLALQMAKLWRPSAASAQPPTRELRYG